MEYNETGAGGERNYTNCKREQSALSLTIW